MQIINVVLALRVAKTLGNQVVEGMNVIDKITILFSAAKEDFFVCSQFILILFTEC